MLIIMYVDKLGMLISISTHHRYVDILGMLISMLWRIFFLLQIDDTIKEILVEFLQIIVGAKFPPSQDYGAKIIYTGKILPQETIIKDVFQTKKDNNVIFIMRTQIKTHSKKRIKPTQKFQGKSIIPI